MAIENRIREALNKVAQSVPHHDLGRIGDSVSNIESRQIQHYKAQIESVYENREVVKLESPCDSLFKASLNPVGQNSFDAWSLSLFVPEELNQQLDDHRIEESVTASLCNDCSGQGRSACNTCSQSGVQQCIECEGKGWVVCKYCHGRYRHNTRSCQRCFLQLDELKFGTAKRYYCEKSGEYQFNARWSSGGANRCPTCKAFLKHKCVDCLGAGHRTCKRCSGKKHISTYLAVRRAFQLKSSSKLIPDSTCPTVVQEQLLPQHFGVMEQLKANTVSSFGTPSAKTSQIVEHLKVRLSKKLVSLWEPIRQLSLQAPVNDGPSPLVEQRLSILQAQVHEFTYTFEGSSYLAWLMPNTIIALESPIIDKMNVIATKATQLWSEEGSADRAAEELHKCFAMAKHNSDCRRALDEMPSGAVPRELYDKAASLETIAGKAGFLFRKVTKRFWGN